MTPLHQVVSTPAASGNALECDICYRHLHTVTIIREDSLRNVDPVVPIGVESSSPQHSQQPFHHPEGCIINHNHHSVNTSHPSTYRTILYELRWSRPAITYREPELTSSDE